jgi:porphobilinogen synthase
MVRETRLSVDNLLLPLFVQLGTKRRDPISSLPGVFRLSPDEAAAEAQEARSLGVPAVILFGIPDRKDDDGRAALDPQGPVCEGVRAIKKAAPELVVVTDVCVDEYTTHGHCGILKGQRPAGGFGGADRGERGDRGERSERGERGERGGKERGHGARGQVTPLRPLPDHPEVDNDATLELLGEMSLVHAKAGADMVAPSDMMDGRVGYIRETLDEADLEDIAIMSYAVKYASAFYGPFREAADSAPKAGDRRGYQMDPANLLEAVREANLDVGEGADMLMVKPALAYLDVIARIRDEFDLPVCAYNVSGEYAMLKAAAEKGWIDHDRVMLEILTGIRRAGADVILTYHAKEAARLIARGVTP